MVIININTIMHTDKIQSNICKNQLLSISD